MIFNESFIGNDLKGNIVNKITFIIIHKFVDVL